MRFPLSWLAEYIEFDVAPEELASRLTMAGLEVEELTRVGGDILDILVAEIVDMGPHPNADKLTLCKVNDGTSTLDIVCGADNMKTGDKVALAPVGTRLPPGEKFPEGMKIKKSKIRGEVSLGMLCAENELGLGTGDDGIMILPPDAQPGTRLIEALGLEDTVIEVGVTPNRADCLSLLGIAREVGAMLGRGVTYPEARVSESAGDVHELASVEIRDTEGCQRYSCRVIRGVTIGPSPPWLVRRLEASGLRPVNNVVDATNYVLLELGQPLHAFDYDLLAGGAIVVRAAGEGEKMVTLDGEERTLSPEDLLICAGERPVALGGVMGGAETEVSAQTANILLESACFSPVRVRKTSRRTGLRSESSYRFERGVDPNGVTRALDRTAALIIELAGGKAAKGVIDAYPVPREPLELDLRVERANAVLGTDIPEGRMAEILASIGMEATPDGGGTVSVRVPTFRVDVEREIDLIEEIARLYGYGEIPTTVPPAAMKTEHYGDRRPFEERIRGVMAGAGFLEVINFSFDDPEASRPFSPAEPVGILNPLSSESSVMRTSLLPALLKNVSMNLNRQEGDLRLFELGRCFEAHEGGGLPDESYHLACAVTGSGGVELWSAGEADFFDLKGVLENLFDSMSLGREVNFAPGPEVGFLHPGISAALVAGDTPLGLAGELHPSYQEKLGLRQRVFIFELNLDRLYAIKARGGRVFNPVPRYPSLRRDVALIVDEDLLAGGILEEIERMKSSQIEDAFVFDVFSGGTVEKQKKSVAISLILRSAEKTLTDDEANEVQEKVLKRLQKTLGTELRKT